MTRIWSCKIGYATEDELDKAVGGDRPLRAQVAQAFEDLFGHPPVFMFTGWGGALDLDEQSLVDDLQALMEGGEPYTVGVDGPSDDPLPTIEGRDPGDVATVWTLLDKYGLVDLTDLIYDVDDQRPYRAEEDDT